MTQIRLTFFAVALALIGLAGPAAANCPAPKESSALAVRALQSELMVGALSCRLKTDYNGFARRFEVSLVRHGQELRGYFARAHGRRSEQELNAYITRLANEQSVAMARGQVDCGQIAALFQALSVMPTEQLEELAALRAQRQGMIVAEAQPALCMADATAK